MRHRTLGRSGLGLPVVTFGAWASGGFQWGGSDDHAAIEAMQRAIDLGMDAIDTAPIYGFGHSERLVGEAIRGRRERVRVLTKAGLRWDDERGELAFEGPDLTGRKRRVFRNSRPDSVRHEVDQSLARLGVERIDLLQIHWPDRTTPLAETFGTLAELVRAGKLGALGASNFSVADLEEAQRALGDIPLASDQPRYSAITRSIEADVLPWAREQRVGILAYSPMERGLLTGKVGPERAFPPTDLRSQNPLFQPEARSRINAVLHDVVGPIAARHGATPGQVALAWVIAQDGVTTAIAGARTAAQVEENARAGELELAPVELAEIRRAFEALSP
jgi:aryl-alcohol dehydrogenase-like predicted oxidoreductase